MKNRYYFQKNNLLTIKAYMILFRHSKLFNIITTAVIITYSLILGFETYYQNSELPSILSFIDYSITIFFVIEIFLKIYAEKNKFDFFKDKWNLFDFIIVMLSLIPLDAFSSIAIARLLRIFRVLRLITINEGVKKLLVALEGAVPSIANVVVIMFVIFYVYAILGTHFFGNFESGLWKNVSISLLTLFRILTFEDWTDVMYEAMEVYPFAWIFFVSFIIINAFVFFNLFVAVIIDEMSKINSNDIRNSLDNEEKELNLILKEIVEIKKSIELLNKKVDRDVI
jgi:voltage-gated sodium channel